MSDTSDMSDTPCKQGSKNCPGPTKVQWRRIDWRPILRIMCYVRFDPTDREIVPPHLVVEGLRQQEVIVTYAREHTWTDAADALTDSHLSWSSIDHDNCMASAGSVFRIPERPGYWALWAPCLACYATIAPLEPPPAAKHPHDHHDHHDHHEEHKEHNDAEDYVVRCRLW